MLKNNLLKLVYLAIAVILIVIASPLIINNKPQSVNQTTVDTTSSNAYVASNNLIKHAIIIVIENAEYYSVINSTNALYQNMLANTYALATNYFAVAHPSEPNYIAMIAGSTLGITDDGSVPQNQKAATNIADLFNAKGISWKAYMESMPIPCDTNNSPDGLYVTRHNPFVYMIGITSNLTYCSEHVVNLTQFYSDLSANQLPQYSFIAPNIDDDGHNTGVAFADKWLSSFIPKITNSSSFSSTAVFLVYDEGATNIRGGGHIAVIIIGPPPIIKQGFKSPAYYSHYSLLATIESIYGLGNLGRADANSTIMNDVFVT